MMGSIEQRLEKLELELAYLKTRETVRELLSKYAVGVDEKRPELLEELFSDDVVLEIPAWNIQTQGKPATITFFEQYWSRFQNPRRYYANEAITVGETTAEAFTYWHVTQEREGKSVLGWGTYDWQFRQKNNRWTVSKEVVHIRTMTELDQGWAGQAGPMQI